MYYYSGFGSSSGAFGHYCGLGLHFVLLEDRVFYILFGQGFIAIGSLITAMG